MRRLESPRGRTATFDYLNINIMEITEKKLDLFTVLLPDDEWSLSLSMLDAIEPYSSKVQKGLMIFGSMLGSSRTDAINPLSGRVLNFYFFNIIFVLND